MLFRIFGVLFTLACTKAIITAGQHLTISPSGTHVKAVNTNAILTCTYADFDLDPSASQLPDIRWTGPDMNYITDTSGRLYVERHDSYSVKLYINKLVESDAGIYSCTLDINGESFKAVTELKLQQDVDFDDTVPDVYRYRIGESGTLGCRATGHPVPTISWRRLGHKLPEDTDKYTYEEDGLTINEIRLEDNGTYECRAQVESAGSLKVRNIHLDVLYPPEFKRFPYVGKVIQGKPAVLECEGDGNPPVRYEWLKEKVMSEKVKAKIPVSKGNNTYTIENPKPSDEGRYYCRISNSVGIKDAHLTVTMLVPPKIQPLTESRVILEGVPLILPCEVTGSPIPQIVWHKMVSEDTSVDVTKLNDTNYSVDHTNEKIGKLIVQNIQRNQSGRYVCMASNEVGNDSSSIQLTVDYQPTMVCSPSESFGWGGQVRNFTCVGHGQPLPTMNWNRQGQYITDNGQLYSVTSSRTSDLVTTTLKISIGPGQPWIFGRYSCTAKNTHGHAARTMQLTEAELPDMPHNVTVIKKTATSVTLQVAKRNQTGGLPVTSWMVKYQADGAPDEDVVTVFFDPGKNLTVVDLEPETEYTIYVAAGNDFGFGNPVKFLVETPTKSLTKEQSDVPREETVDTIVSTDDENGSKGESAALEKTNVSKISPSSGDSGSDYLGVIIGVVVAVVLLLVVAIVLVVVFLRRRRNSDKNKSSSHSQRQGLMSGHRAEVKVGEQADVDSMQLQIRRPDDKLPDLIHSGSGSDRSIGAPGSYSGHPVYSPSPKLGRACAPPTPIRNQAGPTSAQKDAWDRMQQEAVTLEEDNLSLGSDRPVDPKLSILTDHGFYEELKPKIDPERSVADILDGYHSGNELGE